MLGFGYSVEGLGRAGQLVALGQGWPAPVSFACPSQHPPVFDVRSLAPPRGERPLLIQVMAPLLKPLSPKQSRQADRAGAFDAMTAAMEAKYGGGAKAKKSAGKKK